MGKRLTLTGSGLRPRSVEDKGAMAAAMRREVWPLLDAGKVKPVIYRTFPLAEAGEAHRLLGELRPYRQDRALGLRLKAAHPARCPAPFPEGRQMAI